MSTPKITAILSLLLLTNILAHSQHTDANVFGDVKSNNEHLPFVNVYLDGTRIGTTTDITGHYMLIDLPEGKHVLVARAVGYSTEKKEVVVEKGKTLEVNFTLEEERLNLDEVVITGTRTFKRKTESPVIVNILDTKTLESVQACNVSEALRFQPGLRVETDCQTCNYTQLRMNGLGGSYSQILINGRPIFSPLTGLYGMEQIPANMIERIEVVRGGGSALYGSSAIGGTVNIITRIPKENAYDIDLTTQNINGRSMDYILNGNINVLTRQRNAGAAIFVNRRNRQAYDHNEDNFSELPFLENNSFGTNLFIRPAPGQKLEINFTSLNEYRYGGELTDRQAHFAQQSEERKHSVLMGGLDYQINFNEDNSSVISYLAGQYTHRKHYTGILPDAPGNIETHLADPPYGYTDNTTIQAGVQFNHRLREFTGGENVITSGIEYIYDDVFDTIPAYVYETDQESSDIAGFLQSDWSLRNNLNLLTGLRVDKHNLVDRVIVSPRISILYRLKNYMQFRLSWGTGFRVPQAFDTDLHIAFAGGGVSRISLDPDLHEERSNSISASVNFDHATESYIAGFTVEAFYTKLDDAFYLQPAGEDSYGELFVKRNGPGATVRGATIELRGNYNRTMQLEAGFTFQKSLYDEAVENIEGLPLKRKFLRTPDHYGYLNLLLTPTEKINASVNTVYTGPMLLAHFAGAPEQPDDAYKISPSFTEFGFKFGYTLHFASLDTGLELFGGIKNLTNAYQDDFDTGKYRDSNYVYGPGSPRTYYLGIKIKSL